MSHRLHRLLITTGFLATVPPSWRGPGLNGRTWQRARAWRALFVRDLRRTKPKEMPMKPPRDRRGGRGSHYAIGYTGASAVGDQRGYRYQPSSRPFIGTS